MKPQQSSSFLLRCLPLLLLVLTASNVVLQANARALPVLSTELEELTSSGIDFHKRAAIEAYPPAEISESISDSDSSVQVKRALPKKKVAVKTPKTTPKTKKPITAPKKLTTTPKKQTVPKKTTTKKPVTNAPACTFKPGSSPKKGTKGKRAPGSNCGDPAIPPAALAKIPSAQSVSTKFQSCLKTGAAKGFTAIFYTGGTSLGAGSAQYEIQRKQAQVKNNWLQLKDLLAKCGYNPRQIQDDAYAASPSKTKQVKDAINEEYWERMSLALALTVKGLKYPSVFILVPDGMTKAPAQSYYARIEEPQLKQGGAPQMIAVEIPSEKQKPWAI